mmetsp:Transcript_14068/g.23270  ORF Transcript_14068/g.23270 Transcript_14068/m.23270 type:complete len:344 (+) Transcript_14068:1158-2189(+)
MAPPITLPVIVRSKSLADSSYVIPWSAFDPSLVGAKSCNLASLSKMQLPDWIHIPKSAALTFDAFERALLHSCNQEVRESLVQYEARLDTATGDEQRHILEQMRAAIGRMKAPPELKACLLETMKEICEGPVDELKAWKSVVGVWASKWNERAFASRCRVGLSHSSLYMAVLIQPVINAAYAFVLHTCNPLNGARDEVYGEIVCGLGEVLVSNYPGVAASFSCKKSQPSSSSRVLGFPSKSIALYGGGPLIFRSDSNGEDLEGYAGAGLYESIIMCAPTAERPVSYVNERLVWDDLFFADLSEKLTKVGTAIETCMGGVPQDIEGVVSVGGDLYVVQTRPQVL